jgi:hypothetical protein
MSGATISGNNGLYGGGVYVGSGTFTMRDGEISGNTSSFYGGGVYVDSGTFTMSGGTISGNTVSSSSYSSNGGGVYVGGGTFTMSDGEIYGNTSYSYGGGVYVNENSSLFKKSGGTIYGYTDGDNKSNVIKNSSGVVQDDRGHAVYVLYSNSNYIKRKETTAGPGDNLVYIGNQIPPDWDGAWDY